MIQSYQLYVQEQRSENIFRLLPRIGKQIEQCSSGAFSVWFTLRRSERPHPGESDEHFERPGGPHENHQCLRR